MEEHERRGARDERDDQPGQQEAVPERRGRDPRRAAGSRGRTPACSTASCTRSRRCAGTSCCPSAPRRRPPLPSSCRRGVSQRPRDGLSSSSKRSTVPAASAQIGEPAPEEDPERRPRRCEGAPHASTITPQTHARGRAPARGILLPTWLPSPHEPFEAPAPGSARPPRPSASAAGARGRGTAGRSRSSSSCSRGVLDRRGRSRPAVRCSRSGRSATSTPCGRRGSARTRSSTRPTARCSASSRPSGTARS